MAESAQHRWEQEVLDLLIRADTHTKVAHSLMKLAMEKLVNGPPEKEGEDG